MNIQKLRSEFEIYMTITHGVNSIMQTSQLNPNDNIIYHGYLHGQTDAMWKMWQHLTLRHPTTHRIINDHHTNIINTL